MSAYRDLYRLELRLAIAFLMVACMIVGTSQAIAEQAGAVCVRIQAKTLPDVAALRLNPEVNLDYGAFVWQELSSVEFSRLQDSGLPFDVEVRPFTLCLGEMTFDPLEDEPTFPDGWGASAVSGPDLHLVQFRGPIRAEWKDHLEAGGLQIVQYIHPHTFIVWGEAEARHRLADADMIRWTGEFAPAFRALPRVRNLREDHQKVRVLLYRGADTENAVRRIQALGGNLDGKSPIDNVLEQAIFTLAGSSIQAASKVPGVYSIKLVPTDGGLRGEMSDQVCANNVDGTSLAFPGYQAWLTNVGVDGAGVVIANVDGGVQNDHPDLVNRLITCSGTTCGGSTTNNHGTHTAGIMAADGSSGTLDSFGFLRGLGVAPGANLVEQVYSPFYSQEGGMLLLMTDSFNTGASLSGNSWGPSGSPHGYDDDTRQVDVGVRDADPIAPGNQPLSYVLSIMNGNGGTSSQGTPDEAKNIFTIGSTKMQNSSGSQILDIDDISSNSAHGPCLDGREIPHMVAPGCNVDSTVPTSSHAVAGYCGTSMASPHVSGAIALFIEYYRGLPGYTADPSPALIKAAFLPVAHDLAGNQDADGGTLGHPLDSKQGWGRMDLEAVIDPQDSVQYFDDPQIFDNTGEQWTHTVSASDPAKPIRIMLVWTDAPGHGLGGSTPAWNNDLDLIVEEGANTYRGNNFDAGGWSQTGGSADDRNNTEGVFIGPTAPYSYTIRVVAGNISSDGIPNQGDDTDQDFALVCYNCTEEAGLTISVPEGVPDLLPPEQTTDLTVQILEGEETYVPDSAMLHYRYDGGGYLAEPLVPLGGDLYRATLPAPACGDTPQFYFSAQASESGVLYEPSDAPAATFTADVGVYVLIMEDDFETDQGWTVENTDLTDGAWERAIPRGGCDRGSPLTDYDGSGRCYVTDNDLTTCSSDVDGGPTMLLSPTLDLSSATNPVFTYARWWRNDDQDEDPMYVEISDDDGASWTLIERVVYGEGAPVEEWVERTIHVRDYITPLTSQMKIRFSVKDNPNNSINEAGIDAIRLDDIFCGQIVCALRGDLNNDTTVDGADIQAFVDCFIGDDPGTTDCVCADMDVPPSGTFEQADVEAFVNCLLGVSCP